MPYYPTFPFHMGPGACCCPQGCWFFFDDFGDGTARNNTTDLGDNWNEEVGDWGISGWTLVENYGTGGGTADAVLITTQAEPASSAGEQYMQLHIYDAQTGDVYRLYPACPDTETTGPLTATFTCTTAPNQWHISIGAEEKDFVVTPDNGWVTLLCCVDHSVGMAKAWMTRATPASPVWDDNCAPGDGRYSGCGHDNSTGLVGVIADDYFVGELRTAAGVICYDCLCRCRDYAPGKELTLTCYDATGRYACIGGESCTLTFNEDPVKLYWEGNFTVTGPNGVAVQVRFILQCGSEDFTEHEGYNFSLSVDFDGDCCVLNPARCAGSRATDASSCSAFHLVFGPYQATGAFGDLNCWLCYSPGEHPEIATGEFWIAVTP